jgi:uncharacterized protein
MPKSSPRVEIIHLDPQLAARAWDRCQRFADKEWDWIDCVSFEIMDQRGIRSALTLDHHFELAGFQILALSRA